jgi:hypothetical protein
VEILVAMNGSKSIFILRSKGITLGTVELENQDCPWNYGRFLPSEAFSEYEPIFAKAERARATGDAEQRESFIRQIVAMELQLVREESRDLAGEPDLLWICGDRVSWRGHSGALRSWL